MKEFSFSEMLPDKAANDPFPAVSPSPLPPAQHHFHKTGETAQVIAASVASGRSLTAAVSSSAGNKHGRLIGGRPKTALAASSHHRIGSGKSSSAVDLLMESLSAAPGSGPNNALTSKSNLLLNSALPRTGRRSDRIEDEYIQNLQQQIYLLEMETKYLRSKGVDGQEERVENTAAPLRDTMRALKMKYVDLTEKYKCDIESLESRLVEQKQLNNTQALQLRSLETDKKDLVAECEKLLNARADQSDLLHNEFKELRNQHELSLAELARHQQSEVRLKAEKEAVQQRLGDLHLTHRQLQDRSDEDKSIISQLKEEIRSHVHEKEHLRVRCEEGDLMPVEIQSLKQLLDERLQDMKALADQLQKTQSMLEEEQLFTGRLNAEKEQLIKQSADYQMQLVDAQKEVTRMNWVVNEARESEKRKEAERAAKRKELLEQGILKGEGEAMELIEIELAIAQAHVKARDQTVDAQQEKLNQLARVAQEKQSAIDRLEDEKHVLLERQTELARRVREMQDENLQLTDNKRSLEIALETVRQSNSTHTRQLELVTDELNKCKGELQLANQELSRLRKVERVAIQMAEWKSMMENNIKVAAEMQNMLSVFGNHVRQSSSGASNGDDGAADGNNGAPQELITANSASLEYGLQRLE